ncbi:hypothetical protein HPC49_01885 [Pyxidicoccus fallax]|uniref:Lipoprotein n=1 Tax=Pyxidicoccus fallax TaxID=394095 RepID=A0A848LBZ2_9BACT|nr:hypothetical protein [Pyxidicoccus fallax]NMO13811.1 hypothetical protein [Pyxidicoccus fallax]NPC77002.1 hypothetical protein [Pyxidicoccus fallax]
MSSPSAVLRLPWRLLPCVLVLAACGPTMDIPDDAVACANVRCTAGECFSNGGQPMCRCGAWEQAAGLSCAVGYFTAADDHGGSPGDATVLSMPMAVAGQGHIDQAEREGLVDRDLFAFTAESRHVYAFTCHRRTLRDCQLRLLDGTGREVDTVTQNALDGPGRVLFATLEAGTWYVEVSSERGVGTYTYQLQDLGRDDHGDDRVRATALTASRRREPFVITHTGPGDEDVFTFATEPEHGYRFTCEVPDPRSVDSRELELTLRWSTDTVVRTVAGFEGPSLGVSGVAGWEGSASVTVRLKRANQLRLESTCWLEDLGRDDHADSFLLATEVTPGVPVPVTLHSDGDTDVLVFTARAGHIYSLAPEQRGSLNLLVTDVLGFQVASQVTSQLLFEPARDATYYLHVRQGVPWLYRFLLLLEDQGTDDHGDARESATSFEPGTPVTGRAETPGDVDAFTFLPEANGIYLVTCEPDCLLSYYHPEGLRFETLGPGRQVLDVSGAQPTTVFVRPGGVSAYTLRVERVATDDYGDSRFDAIPLTLPATVSGWVQTRVDVDAFLVWLDGGRTYWLDLDLGPLQLTLTAPDGSTLPRWDSGFVVPASGTYLVQVHGATGDEVLPWRFGLQAR